MRNRVSYIHLCILVFTAILLSVLPVNAQDKPKPATSDAPATKPQFPAAKKQAAPAASTEEPAALHNAPATEIDRDSAEQVRKRDEWFYKQRSSANGRIPAGARFKAFQHMQRMMAAEGKLVLRPDGSYAAAAAQPAPQGVVTTSWGSIGPTPTTGGFFSPVTGRVTTIAVDPSDSTGNTVLLGGAMGGIWRSTDAGATWKAVGDQNASLAMGSIAFAPSACTPLPGACTVYAGTGESASIGFDIYYGAGVLKSADHGQTWTQTCTVAGTSCPFIGPYNDIAPFGFFTLGGTRISYVAVNPTNPQMVLVGAQTQFSQGVTEGVYCSDDSGAHWSQILADQMSTFVGFASSTVAYAALGDPFGNQQLPNGNGIYKATSIGATCATIHFLRLTSTALPAQSVMGRIDIGIAPSDISGNTVYASISNAADGSATNLGVFATTNGGTTWTQTAAPDICQHQCWYDNVVKVDPSDPKTAFFGGSAVIDSSRNYSWVMRTRNGGTNWSTVIPNLPPQSAGLPHVDNHALAFVKLPTGKVRLYLGNDGGIWRTDDAEASSFSWINLNNPSLTLTQFYPFISINASSPSFSFGGTQDNASQNYQGGTSWVDNGLCGDGSSTATDFLIPSTVYIGCATGIPINASYQNGAIGSFFPAVNGINLSDASSFIPPLAADPNAANTLYYGTTKVYQTTDAGNTWIPISNDLVSGSNGNWLNTITPANSGVVYAGANSGHVFAAANVTPGTFANFNPVSGQGSLPPRQLTAIAADPTDATGNTAYAAFSGFSFVNASTGINDITGHLFQTKDGGNTWKDVSCSVAVCTTPNLPLTDLPNIPVNDVVVDPDLSGTIYAGTDLGVFVGNCSALPCTWTTLGTGLPRSTVHSLRLHEASRTLRAATHGRGAWDIFLNNFSFSGPRIFSLSPTSANTGAASFTLTVKGTGLTNGTVLWNGSATNVMTAQVSDTQLTAQVNTALLVAGTPKVTVKVGTSTPSNALTFSVLASVPTLTSVTPSSTPVQTTPNKNVSIQLTGTGFASSAKILFNGAQSGITIVAPTGSCPLPTCLAATLPAALLGPFGSTNDIAVLNTPPGGGLSKSLTFKVAAAPPPNDNFLKAINITTFTFNDVRDSSGATTETADPVPPCVPVSQIPGSNQFTARSNTIWYKFTPLFSANLNVDTIGSSYDSVLSIWTGSPGSFVNVACNDDINPGIVIQSQLSNVPLTAGTTYYIMVSSFGPPDPNPVALGGRSQLKFSYNNGIYPTPTITSLSPASANSGDPGFTLTVNGSSFFNGATVHVGAAGTGTPLNTTFVSPTQLTAVVPASVVLFPGSFFVEVWNPPISNPSNDLTFTVNVGTYPVPTLSSISPNTYFAGSILPLTISAYGTNFASTATLDFNGATSQIILISSDHTFLQAIVPAAAFATPGTVQVNVSNPTPGGGPSNSLPFTITVPSLIPTITSLNPSSAVAGAFVTVTVTGTGFLSGAEVCVATPTGVGCNGTTFISSTQLSTGVSLPSTTGNIAFYVVEGGTSAPFNFTVTQPPPPTITSISPMSAPTGSRPTLTITGTNFLSQSNILFNNQNNLTGSSYLISGTQLTTTLLLDSVASGTYPITVVNLVGTPMTSNAKNFTVTGPPDFSITSSGITTQTVPAGQTATFTNVISVTAQSGFASQVNLSCSLPYAATATHCSVSPTSFASGSGTASVMVTTQVRGLVPTAPPTGRFYLPPKWVPILLLTILLAALLLRFARTRRQRLAGVLPLAGLILFLMLQTIGCGSGGYTTGPPPPTGTPVGTYTVTVTATDGGALTHSSTLTLIVQ